jgi:TIR domain
MARPLYLALWKLGCPTWYSEYALKVGDSLREGIENGLKTCPTCIFLLTPKFLGSNGWPKAEFNSVFTREMLEGKTASGKNRILPVWHEVTPELVYDYSPTLADRLGLQWQLGVEEVARQLFNQIRDRRLA